MMATQSSGKSLGVAANNRLTNTGFAYDSAGNMTNDGSTQYVYDVENRIKSAGVSTNYVYDADGKRVKKEPGKLYWTGTGSDPLAESDLSGPITAEYVFFNGKRIARLDLSPSVAVHYYFSDHLGSASVVTNADGSVIQDESDYFPFGGERSLVSGDPNQYKFTGKERDAETGLDYFGARYYGNSLARFTSPDPLYLEARRLSDPQRLNLFTYTRNNPLIHVDPTGMEFEFSGDAQAGVDFLNKRKGAQFQTKLGKNGKLEVLGKVNKKELSKSERALYDSITSGPTAKINVTSHNAGVDFGRYDKPGSNTVDVEDLSLADKQSPGAGGHQVAHEMLESYFSLAKKEGFTAAHQSADSFFGELQVVGESLKPPIGPLVTGATLDMTLRGTNLNFTLDRNFVTPVPRETLFKAPVPHPGHFATPEGK